MSAKMLRARVWGGGDACAVGIRLDSFPSPHTPRPLALQATVRTLKQHLYAARQVHPHRAGIPTNLE